MVQNKLSGQNYPHLKNILPLLQLIVQYFRIACDHLITTLKLRVLLEKNNTTLIF